MARTGERRVANKKFQYTLFFFFIQARIAAEQLRVTAFGANWKETLAALDRLCGLRGSAVSKMLVRDMCIDDVTCVFDDVTGVLFGPISRTYVG